MKKRLFKILPAAAIALTSFAGAAQGADAEVPMETYKLSDGTSCFLVPLQAEAVESTSEYVDVAALIDFSASQLDGEVRAAAREAVDSLVANLPANARVQLFAVSNETEALTDGYVAVDSQELQDAIASLKDRAPLGAADLEKSLTVAADSFDYSENADRAIVFVGRGVSSGAAFDETVFNETVEKLVDAKVPVSSFGVGANVNARVLGALANRTGGVVAFGEPQEAGEELATAATATVYWPEDATLSIANADVYPNPLPPIRSDRETYVIGVADELTELEISLPTVVADGRQADISWIVAPQESNDGNKYLYNLVQSAATDSGATLAIAGRSLLVQQQLAVGEANDQIAALAEQANEAGDAADAARLADLVDVGFTLQDDADAPEDEAVAVAESGDEQAARMFAAAEKVVQNQNQANLIDASERNVKLITAQIKTHARAVISNALKDSKTDPDGALQDLKLTINAVKQNAQITAADREIILHDLSATAQNVAYEKEAKARRDYAAMQNQAIVDSQRQATDAYKANQAKVVEIMKRFDSLIKEGQFVLASQAADEAAKQGVDPTIGEQASDVALLRDAYTENQYLRFERRKRLLEVLMSVERSHIPVSDEPPISYPDAETWITLSKVRKAKYNATNITGTAEEQRIARALDVKVDVAGGEDSDLTLTDWIDEVKRTLKDQGQDINIVFDNTNIEEVGDAPSSMMVRESLSGITLRRALKVVLRPYDLDFCIDNDCLFITTQDEIKNNPDISTSLQLYSVGDLIMQPNSGGSMMGGGMGGMGGGMMGGMGGGMMGGMGGGMMGGMGGGMGGGMWNVDQPRRSDRKSRLDAIAPEANDAILKNFLEGGAAAPEVGAGLFAVPSKSTKAAQTAKPAGTLAQAPVDLNAKWDAYFATNGPKELKDDATDAEKAAYEKALEDFNMETMAKVVETTKTQPESAVALIKSALRNGYGASWMYEALAAALIQAKAPQAEVETAILSVADFSDDPVVLMGLAAYLEKVGSEKRALKIYQDVSRVAPTRPEPYVRGLALAQKLNDEEAQKWVVLGIASLMWDGKLYEDVELVARDLAFDLVEKMQSEGRETEAAQFERDVNLARVRDVMVEIAWSGDAELDLAVEEPTKAVCWFAQKRTASGGVLSDVSTDLSKSFEENREGLRTRMYACPMGFTGEYNFLVSRTWGTVAQNKVTVTIRTNVGTEEERVGVQVFELEGDEALFTVNLESGRRSEEIKEEILTASAMMNQLQTRSAKELGDRVAAYRSASAENSAINSNRLQAASNEYVSSYKADQATAEDAEKVPQITYSVPEPGQMPVISQFTLGAGFTVAAGISGDRRYVLLNPQPMFQGLVKMFTYNSSDGSSSTSYGGGNNNGNGGYGGNNNMNGGGMNGGYGGGMNGGMGGMGGGMNGGYGGGMGGMGSGNSW